MMSSNATAEASVAATSRKVESNDTVNNKAKHSLITSPTDGEPKRALSDCDLERHVTRVKDLCNLTSNLATLFGAPFTKDVYTPTIEKKWEAASKIVGDKLLLAWKQSKVDVSSMYRDLLNAWMRLENIDPFHLSGQFAESVDYLGTFELGKFLRSLLNLVEIMLESMPNASDRLVARKLIASVLKKWAHETQTLILEHGNAGLSTLNNSFSRAVSHYEKLLDEIIAIEKGRLRSDWSQFHSKYADGGSPLRNLAIFDRRTAVFVLVRTIEYLKEKGSFTNEDFVSDLLLDNKLTSTGFDQRMSFRQTEILKPSCDKETPPVQDLLRFVETVPFAIRPKLYPRAAKAFESEVNAFYIEAHPHFRSPFLLGSLPRAYTDIIDLLHRFISNNTSSTTNNLLPFAKKHHLCAKCFLKISDWSVAIDFGHFFAPFRSWGAEDFFKITETVLSLADYCVRILDKSVQIFKKEGRQIMWTVGFLLAHLYFLLKCQPQQKAHAATIGGKVRECMSKGRERASKLSTPATRSFLSNVFLIAERIVDRFLLILKMDIREQHSFAALPTDKHFGLSHDSGADIFQLALEHGPFATTRSIALHKRVSLFTTFALSLLKHKSAYEPIFSLYSKAVAKVLTDLLTEVEEANKRDSSPRYYVPTCQPLNDFETNAEDIRFTISAILRDLRSGKIESRLSQVTVETVEVSSSSLLKGEPFVQFFTSEVFPYPHLSAQLQLWFKQAALTQVSVDRATTWTMVNDLAETMLAFSRPDPSSYLCDAYPHLVTYAKDFLSKAGYPSVVKALRFHVAWLLRRAMKNYMRRHVADELTNEERLDVPFFIAAVDSLLVPLDTVKSDCADEFGRFLVLCGENPDQPDLLKCLKFLESVVPTDDVKGTSSQKADSQDLPQGSEASTTQPIATCASTATSSCTTASASTAKTSVATALRSEWINQVSEKFLEAVRSAHNVKGAPGKKAGSQGLPRGSESSTTESVLAFDDKSWTGPSVSTPASQSTLAGSHPVLTGCAPVYTTQGFISTAVNQPTWTPAPQTPQISGYPPQPPPVAPYPWFQQPSTFGYPAVMRYPPYPIPTAHGVPGVGPWAYPAPVQNPAVAAPQAGIFQPNPAILTQPTVDIQRSAGAKPAAEQVEPDSKDSVVELSFVPVENDRKRHSRFSDVPKKIKKSGDSVFLSDDVAGKPSLETSHNMEEQIRDLEQERNFLSDKLEREFGDPDFLARFLGVSARSGSENILYKLSYKFSVYEKIGEIPSCSKFSNELALLENAREILKRKLDEASGPDSLESMERENRQLMRRSAILRDLVVDRNLEDFCHLRADLIQTAVQLELLLPKLRELSKESTEQEFLVNQTVAKISREAMMTILRRTLPEEKLDFASKSGFFGVAAALRICAESYLTIQNDVEKLREALREALPGIQQIVEDRDSRIAELSSRLAGSD